VIEDCSDLLECEARLSEEIHKVGLLGQIAFPSEDLNLLGTLIHQAISPNISRGTRILENDAPTCLACFLVWTGIVGYRDGDYWSAVCESTGLPAGPNWEQRWGQAFLNFLEANDLPRFEIEGSHTYVTPILTHGGIPNSCLDEYFERLLLPLIQRELVNPADSTEVIHELTLHREDDRERASAEQRHNELKRQVRTLSKLARQAGRVVKAYEKVVSLWADEAAVKTGDPLPELLADYETFRTKKLEEIQRLDDEVRELTKKREHFRRISAEFTEQDNQALGQAEAIERSILEYPELKNKNQTLTALLNRKDELTEKLSAQSAGIFGTPWREKYGKLLVHLPLNELREEIGRLQDITSRQDEIRNSLNQLWALPGRALPPIKLILAASFLLLIGLALIVVGILVLGLWALTITGAGFALAAAFVVWIWHQKKGEKSHLKVLEQSLSEATSSREEALGIIANLLCNLPIAEHQLQSPSPELHQALVTLVDIYHELLDIRQLCEQLQQHVSQQAREIERVVASTGFEPTVNLINTMKRKLEDAQKRQAAAVQAENQLDLIPPKLTELSAMQEEAREELRRVERQLSELGEGDIQTGVGRMQEQRQRQARVAKMRAELEEEYPDLAAIEREIQSARKSGKDKEALQIQVREFAEQLKEARGQAKKAHQELACYPPVFPGVDKPIRRYLLYGGKPAEEFLVGSVLLAHRSLTEGRIPAACDVGLPERVVTAFEHWWPQYVAELERHRQLGEREAGLGQRFRVPTIFLDPAMAEILVCFHAQRYVASVDKTNTYLEVAGSTPGSQRRSYPLRVYRKTGNLLETQEFEFPLPFPAERYHFGLRGGSDMINQWEVPALCGDVPYMAFEGRSGKLIREEELPQGKVRLVIGKGTSLEPAECVLEKSSLQGKWKSYNFLELNLGDIDKLKVVDDRGRCLLIPASSEKSPAIDLVGGRRLQGAYSDGMDVYVASPTCIRVPIAGEVELRLWRLSIFPDEGNGLESKHHRLSELQGILDVHTDEGWVDVQLADERLLGRQPVGRFTVRARKPPYTDWRSKFCVVPGLQITFDKEIYPPYEEENAPPTSARISAAKAAEFIPQLPAKLRASKDDVYVIAIGGDEDALEGTLCFPSPDGDGLQIPLSISIPKLKWRLRGLEDDRHTTWSNRVEEVWLGDWETVPELFLVIMFPPFVDQRIRLSVGDISPIEREAVLHEGKARFDLLAFGDALRAGSSVQTVVLTLPDPRFGIEHTALFKVRTRWEVKDVNYVQKSEKQATILDITWGEEGKVGSRERVVRLWNPSSARPEPIVEQKRVTETRVTLQTNKKELPPGEYLLEFALEDPWSTTKVSRPNPDDPNVGLVEIVPIVETRQDETINIRSIADYDGEQHQLDKDAFKIAIVGKIRYLFLPRGIPVKDVLVTRTNEGWYVGNLSTANPELEEDIRRANPVKFEYDASKEQVTAIEDRYGEGAMYCKLCRRLYWSQEAVSLEEQRGHPLIGPIESFEVDWERQPD
jgi:hypothetical protein